MSVPPAARGSDDRSEDLARIEAALQLAREVLDEFTPGEVASRRKAGGDPVTEADIRIDAVLRDSLPRAGEGWLSEETADDAARLSCRRAWIVDPIDGTREFVEGLPEWCVSIGLVEDGRPVAGGVLNPAAGCLILGAAGHGVTIDGEATEASERTDLRGATVLASRSECRRGEWDGAEGAGFTVRPMGSVAYKIALVAAGRADATWTLRPKHEWDVAAGIALVLAAGGRAWRPDGGELGFNRPSPRLESLAATAPGLETGVRRYLDARSDDSGR